ncbi:MAG: DUF2490 domain-containing protein [Cyclobacteriaceae bacterium]
MCFTKKKLLFALLLFFSPLLTLAQSPLLRWEPDLSYSWKPADRWSFNTSAGGRNTWFSQQENGPEGNYAWEHVEIRLFATYSLFGDNRVGGGYQFRWRDPLESDEFGYEHRTQQQFAFISYTGTRRLSHRIRSEQRIRDIGFIQRFRYRLSYEFPLTGDQIDPGEKYLVLSNEVVYSISDAPPEIDNRLYLGLGWFFNRQRQLETGLQFRVEAYNTETPEPIFHLNTTYFLSR